MAISVTQPAKRDFLLRFLINTLSFLFGELIHRRGFSALLNSFVFYSHSKKDGVKERKKNSPRTSFNTNMKHELK